MRHLLRFMPRPRMKTATTRNKKQMVSTIVDHLQVLAPLDDSDVILKVIEEYIHNQRRRLQRKHQHDEAHAHSDR